MPSSNPTDFDFGNNEIPLPKETGADDLTRSVIDALLGTESIPSTVKNEPNGVWGGALPIPNRPKRTLELMSGIDFPEKFEGPEFETPDIGVPETIIDDDAETPPDGLAVEVYEESEEPTVPMRRPAMETNAAQ